MSNHVPTDSGDIYGELAIRYANSLYTNTWNCYVIFTHQWQPINAIKNALDDIGTFALEKGIYFDYPQNKWAYPTPKDIK